MVGAAIAIEIAIRDDFRQLVEDHAGHPVHSGKGRIGASRPGARALALSERIADPSIANAGRDHAVEAAVRGAKPRRCRDIC